MPVVIKSTPEIEAMRQAGAIVAQVHSVAKEAIAPGVTTSELERVCRNIIESEGAKPSFLGYNGFPAAVCISVDEEIVHGMPSDRVLREGQIVTIDVGAYFNGFHGDAAATYPVGVISPAKQELIEATESAFWAGFEQAVVGNRIGDISVAIQLVAEERGLGIIREYGGHGIGRLMHEDPSILNWGDPNTGIRLQPGMTFAIEPMFCMGSEETIVLEDEWTVVTIDRTPSAHFEHTILITVDTPEVLTWHHVV